MLIVELTSYIIVFLLYYLPQHHVIVEIVWLLAGDVEHGAVHKARDTGEAAGVCLYQQGGSSHTGAQTAARRRLLQAAQHHRRDQQHYQVK